jgi:hypothetical protein
MGTFNTTDRVETLQRSAPLTVFSAQTLSDGDKSTSVAIPYNKNGNNIWWDLLFGSAPTTVSFILQVAMDNVEVSFHDTGDAVTAVGGGAITIANVVGNFARIKATDADVETVTARIMVG